MIGTIDFRKVMGNKKGNHRLENEMDKTTTPLRYHYIVMLLPLQTC
jgi:hypothetical protein